MDQQNNIINLFAHPKATKPSSIQLGKTITAWSSKQRLMTEETIKKQMDLQSKINKLADIVDTLHERLVAVERNNKAIVDSMLILVDTLAKKHNINI